jgi:hypothetical protein
MSVTISETSEGKRRGNPDWLPVMSYDEARKVVSKKGFKNLVEYRAWVEQEKPEGFSINPYAIYKYRGEWVSARHFLGKTDYTTDTKVVASEDKNVTGIFPFHKIRTIINQILHPKVNV